jgi:hypothetical protein
VLGLEALPEREQLPVNPLVVPLQILLALAGEGREDGAFVTRGTDALELIREQQVQANMAELPVLRVRQRSDPSGKLSGVLEQGSALRRRLALEVAEARQQEGELAPALGVVGGAGGAKPLEDRVGQHRVARIELVAGPAPDGADVGPLAVRADVRLKEHESPKSLRHQLSSWRRCRRELLLQLFEKIALTLIVVLHEGAVELVQVRGCPEALALRQH